MTGSLRTLAARARRRLARGPAGTIWRQVRSHRGGAQPTAAPPSPATARPAQPPAPPRLDLELYAVPEDPEVAAAVLTGAFGHGYLLGSTPDPPTMPGFLERWATRRVGPLWLRTAPRTVVTVAEQDGCAVLLLGHPVDVDANTTDAQLIADRLLALIDPAGESAAERIGPSVPGAPGHQRAVRAAAYLAGRWTAVLLSQRRRDADLRSEVGSGAGRTPWGTTDVTVLTDAMGSQPVFYAVADDAVTFASADVLVALATDRPVEPLLGLLNQELRQLRPRGVIFLPGDVTLFDGVSQMVPNCLLSFSTAEPGLARHLRYWPFEPRVESHDLAAVHAEFADRVRRQLALFAELGPLGWSLTGGLDSRVLLAHLDRACAPEVTAFTYFNPRDGAADTGAARDAFVANDLAHRLGMPHRLLRWRQAPPGSTFRRVYDATQPLRYTSHGAAHTMWADLPHDLVEVQGNGGEIGTVFRRNRNTDPLTPTKATDIWLGSAFAQRPRYVDLLAAYLEHGQLTDERLLGYSHYDVLYWELRMGRWGWTKFLAGDLSHRVMPPFNDRRLLEAMLSLPEEQRVSKALYTQVLRDAPHLKVEDEES